MTVADLETLGPGDEQVEVPRDSSGKKISGRSPTRIALERLRKDKLALVCGSIVLILVLCAIFAGPLQGVRHRWPLRHQRRR